MWSNWKQKCGCLRGWSTQRGKFTTSYSSECPHWQHCCQLLQKETGTEVLILSHPNNLSQHTVDGIAHEYWYRNKRKEYECLSHEKVRALHLLDVRCTHLMCNIASFYHIHHQWWSWLPHIAPSCTILQQNASLTLVVTNPEMIACHNSTISFHLHLVISSCRMFKQQLTSWSALLKLSHLLWYHYFLKIKLISLINTALYL